MFRSQEGLNFFRTGIQKAVDITLEGQTCSSSNKVKVVTKQVKVTPVKIGASVVSEHSVKEGKIKEIRMFLAHCDKSMCSRGQGDPCSKCCEDSNLQLLCFESFKNVQDQIQSIYNLRMKFFGPSISRKKRRSVLQQEMRGMVKVVCKHNYFFS
jgi:hypothetical protein